MWGEISMRCVRGTGIRVPHTNNLTLFQSSLSHFCLSFLLRLALPLHPFPLASHLYIMLPCLTLLACRDLQLLVIASCCRFMIHAVPFCSSLVSYNLWILLHHHHHYLEPTSLSMSPPPSHTAFLCDTLWHHTC